MMAVSCRQAARFWGCPLISVIWRGLPDAGGFEAFSSHPAAKACWGPKEPSLRGNHLRKGMIQELSWQRCFQDSTQWRDNKQTEEKTPQPPGFRLKSNSKKAPWSNNGESWSATMRRPAGSVSTWVQGASGRIAAHELGTCVRLCEDGQLSQAVDALNVLVHRGWHPDSDLLYLVLKRCIAKRDLGLGRRIHAISVESGYDRNAFLATHLIGLYASHRRLEEAMRVFSKVSTPNAHMWSSIILAYARHGDPKQAIQLYRQMRESTVKPDNHIFVAVLKACATAGDLAAGKDVHVHILASARKSDMFVQNSLVYMYARCGSLNDAQTVFDRLFQKNVVTWTSMIAGYAQQGMGQKALSLYSTMQQEEVQPPDSVTFVCLLQACASVGVAALVQGKQLHAHIQDRGLQGDVLLGASLVNMYSKCGSVKDARTVFDRLSQKNMVTWTAMITGYAQQGMGQEALNLHSSMQQGDIAPPDSVTFVSLLQACASVGALHQGKQLHAQLEERGLHADVVVSNNLVNMYAKCGSLEYAQRLFDRLTEKDVVTWNAMMAGYAQQGMGQEALNLYSTMQQEGNCAPDSVTFASLLQACACVGSVALHHGKQLHAEIGGRLQNDVVLGNSLVNMYAKCGSIEDAQRLFVTLSRKDVVTWNTMIAGYAQGNMFQEALNLYRSMQQEGITAPDSVTFACLLQACASVGLAALHQGKQLHAQIEEQGLQVNVVVGNSLINMYAKCGSLKDAQRVFDILSQKDVVTWNTMIGGYAHQGMVQEALSLFCSMQQHGFIPPNSVTFVCLLHACARGAALPLGKQLHAQIEVYGLQAHGVVGNSLVNMYAKCGILEDAQQVFDSLPEKDTVAWGALIAGYARQGHSDIVFELVDRMKEERIQLDSVTFLSLLTVCSHVGLVDKGRKYFEAMTKDYRITPTIEHYTCMMDLLSRAGHLDEALQMVKAIPFQPDVAVWLALLGACRKWSNVEIGRHAFEFAVRLDEKDGAAYVLMSNIYAGAQMWDEATVIHTRRVKCGAWKEPGQTWWTDMDGVVHTFLVGDRQEL